MYNYVSEMYIHLYTLFMQYQYIVDQFFSTPTNSNLL